MKDVKKPNSNPDPMFSSPTFYPLGYGTATAESTGNLWYLCTVLINVYVASPDPDPNPRGGGQLPNPKSAILR